MIEWSHAPQGTNEWLAARRGRITASMFGTAIETTAKGAPTSKATLYAMNIARERVGGKAPDVYQNAAMRFGTEQEALARVAYEDATGHLVSEVGFAYTTEGLFGGSVDGLVEDDGMIEVKTMVSSDTLFRAVVDGDHGDYIDQINGCMWLLHRKWCDLVLWAPDIPGKELTIVRIERNDDVIDALVEKLMAFERMVSGYEARLRKAIGHPADDSPPWSDTKSGVKPITGIPTSIFD